MSSRPSRGWRARRGRGTARGSAPHLGASRAQSTTLSPWLAVGPNLCRMQGERQLDRCTRHTDSCMVKGAGVGDILASNYQVFTGRPWGRASTQHSTANSLSASWGPLLPCSIAAAKGEEWAGGHRRVQTRMWLPQLTWTGLQGDSRHVARAAKHAIFSSAAREGRQWRRNREQLGAARDACTEASANKSRMLSSGSRW